MPISLMIHLYKRLLVISFLLLWSYPMFAQLYSTEIKVVDALVLKRPFGRASSRFSG